jgi:hypothetical protein
MLRVSAGTFWEVAYPGYDGGDAEVPKVTFQAAGEKGDADGF